MHNTAIILVNPQMGENIGAAARAMKNFQISDLRLISPRDGWPNEKANSMSVGALNIIQNAVLYDNISDAISDLEYVYAATAAPRNMNKEYILSSEINRNSAEFRNIGIIFGRESSGLTNDEISYANKILTIDTDRDFSSLNLAHSVAVICYELFKNKDKGNSHRDDLSNEQKLATHRDLNYFYKHLFQHLEQKNFFKTPEKKQYMQLKIRNLFNRIDRPSKQEIQTLHGIIDTIILDVDEN